MREKDGQIVLCYVSELNCLPRDSGSLKYESLTKRWLHMHPNQRVQGMAECFLQSYLEKRGRNERERNDG